MVHSIPDEVFLACARVAIFVVFVMRHVTWKCFFTLGTARDITPGFVIVMICAFGVEYSVRGELLLAVARVLLVMMVAVTVGLAGRSGTRICVGALVGVLDVTPGMRIFHHCAFGVGLSLVGELILAVTRVAAVLDVEVARVLDAFLGVRTLLITHDITPTVFALLGNCARVVVHSTPDEVFL